VLCAYRIAPPIAPPSVVVYRPNGAFWRWFGTALLLLNFAAAAYFAAWAAGRVTVDCSRATGSCTVTSTYPVRGTVRRSYALDSIDDVEVVRVSSGDGVGLALKTTGGPVALSRTTEAAWLRQYQRRTIHNFLLDGRMQTVHVDYDEPSVGSIVWLFWGVLPLLSLFGIWRRARLRFDWVSKAVILERSSWPLGRTSRAFSLDDVTGADVDERPSGGSTNEYRLVLTLASGDRVPLLFGSTGRRGHPLRVAEEIQSVLRQNGSWGRFVADAPFGLDEAC
jgi:hypothetical protein